MTDYNPESLDWLRQAFKILNKFMVMLFRLGLGSYGNRTKWGGYVMVITHTGRKTGLRRRTPVNYAIVDGELYCMAGFGRTSDWYVNLKADPNVEVWLPDSWWAGVAEEVTDAQARLPLIRQVAIGSGFAAFAAGINPYTISDEELERITAPYCLFHIRRTEARTGPGGPGDLAWVWPLSTLVLLIMLLTKRRKTS
jgi:deazaflavin-dependent oxidoreductase (nitroreductase family)